MTSRLRKIFERPESRLMSVCVALYAAKMVFLFRGIDFSSVWPITTNDYLLYYARALRMHEFLVRSGRFWGYDPFEMAGYVCGPIHEAGNHLIGLICHGLAGFVSIRDSLFFMEVAGIVFGPFAVVGFVRLVGGSPWQSWASFGAFAAGYMVNELDVLPYGLFGFNMSFLCSLLLVGFFYRWLKTGFFRYWAALTALTCLVPQLHPVSMFVFGFPIGLLYLRYARSLPLLQHLYLLVTFLVSFLTNWYWISPTVDFNYWIEQYPIAMSRGWKGFVQIFGPVQGAVYTYVRSSIALCMVFYCYCGFWKRKIFPAADKWIFFGWIFYALAIGLCGSRLMVFKEIQPFRFLGVTWGLLAVFSGFGLAEKPADGLRLQRFFFGGLLVFVSYFFLGVVGLTYFRPLQGLSNRIPQQGFIDFLKKKPPYPGRLLIESMQYLTVPDPYVHFADIVPSYTGQMTLGGPLPYVFMRSRFSTFMGNYIHVEDVQWDKPIAFNRPLSDFNDKTFGDMLAAYHVSAVAAHTPLSIEVLNGFKKSLRLNRREGLYNFYDVLTPSTWFFEGRGHARFDYDRIEISEASPGRLVVKSHWIETFETRSGVSLFPVHYGFDPVPFIGIDNTARADKIVIVNSGGR